MRAIKFRAWDEDVKQMVEWDCLRETQLLDDGFDNNLCVLMQFTGLKDKNDNEIYEGDIVRHRDPGGIMSHPSETIFQVKQEESARYLSFGCLAGKNEYDMEIIGNIFENSELLEGWSK